MTMPVMQIRVVRVGVYHALMSMRMRMRLCHRPIMRMLVVFVVDVAVLMLQRFVDVFVRVALGKMNPEAGAHQDAREHQSHSQQVL